MLRVKSSCWLLYSEYQLAKRLKLVKDLRIIFADLCFFVREGRFRGDDGLCEPNINNFSVWGQFLDLCQH